MKSTALATVIALAFAGPAFAQEAPQNAPIATQPTADQAADNTLPRTHHSTTVYHGPHRYPLHSRGREGDPAIIDHSDDTLAVEPTHSSITIMVPTVPPQQQQQQ